VFGDQVHVAETVAKMARPANAAERMDMLLSFQPFSKRD
jgi:hypothetical protein